MVLRSCVHSTMLRIFELPDFIFSTNDRESFIVEMRSELPDARFDGSEVHNTVLRTPLYNAISQFLSQTVYAHFD
ncbi:hypothetical protein RHMOL_Rhmol05G0216000 [Rhododendron molle]|uniref:Uncharacterized protein n=1 Tax=Rhododendron molle TaxID=49168 RepID=A0ACC0NRS2_RHOML|nr:hypothetical protein RHMOL_Rhmol05G0216000 [Rhododendron molle]